MPDDRFQQDDQTQLPVGPDQVDRLCDEFTKQRQSGGQPSLEGILGLVPAGARPRLLHRLLEIDLRLRNDQGESPSADEYYARFPTLREVVDDVFQTLSITEDSTADPSLAETRDLHPKESPIDISLAPGERIGRYLIRKILGKGSFGSVYLAHDEELDREVAVKLPIFKKFASLESVGRFIDEARNVARLKHPGIVPVYDAGRCDDGRPYIVMQYVEGESLKAVLESKRRLSNEHTARLMANIAEAVAYAHKQGLVHRDLKPANVLLDGEGKPLVADFGLAIAEKEQRERTGEVAGTLQYMAPEQVRGDVHLMDGRADIWALGVMLYEMLTGRRPFVGSNVEEVFSDILQKPPRPPRMIDETISKELERIVLKCLNKSIADRYTSAIDLARDLRNWDQSGKAAPVKIIAGVACAFVILITAVIAWRLTHQPSVHSEVPRAPVDAVDSRHESNLAAMLAEMRGLRRDLGETSNNNLRGQPPQGADANQPAPDRLMSAANGQTRASPWLAGFSDLESQIKEAKQSGDEDREQRLLLKATNDLIDVGRIAHAEQLALRMVELAGNDPADLPIAYGQLGLAQYHLGKLADAISSYQRALDVYQSHYDRMQRLPDSDQVIEFRSHLARLLGMTLMRIGNVHKAADDYSLAQASYEESKQILQAHNRSSELATLLLNYGGLESGRGNYDRAIDLLSQGISIVREAGDSDGEAEFLVNLGNTYSRKGDNQAALKQYQLAYDCLNPKSAYALRSVLLGNWIRSLLEEGESLRAQKLLLELQEIAHPDDKQSQTILEVLPALNDSIKATLR